MYKHLNLFFLAIIWAVKLIKGEYKFPQKRLEKSSKHTVNILCLFFIEIVSILTDWYHLSQL